MLAVAVAALAVAPAIPPEPIDPPPQTWIDSAPTATAYETTGHFLFSSTDGFQYRCTLDGGATFACTEDYTTPVLGLGSHTLTVAARGVGGWDLSPAGHTWTIATQPAPTPTATPTPTPAPAEPTPVPTVTPEPTAVAVIADTKPVATPLTPIDISLLYFMNAKQRYTRFATLSVKGVPAGATITVTCTGGCPRRSQTLTAGKGGTVRLSKWLGKRLKTGATLTIAVAKPGMRGMTKTLTMRAQRRPRIVTKALP
jgi:hypothetical protein